MQAQFACRRAAHFCEGLAEGFKQIQWDFEVLDNAIGWNGL
jgi:hypothetical protein